MKPFTKDQTKEEETCNREGSEEHDEKQILNVELN
jgi:hypothetical protein